MTSLRDQVPTPSPSRRWRARRRLGNPPKGGLLRSDDVSPSADAERALRGRRRRPALDEAAPCSHRMLLLRATAVGPGGVRCLELSGRSRAAETGRAMLCLEMAFGGAGEARKGERWRLVALKAWRRVQRQLEFHAVQVRCAMSTKKDPECLFRSGSKRLYVDASLYVTGRPLSIIGGTNK